MIETFGRDLSCTTSLRTGRYVTGVRLVAEAVFRRLTTPRGMLRGGEDEENYGIDLLDMIGSVSTKSDAAALEGRIRSELLKDERLESVTVRVISTTTGASKAFDIFIACTTSEGPFDLELGVDEVTVEILNLRAED